LLWIHWEIAECGLRIGGLRSTVLHVASRLLLTTDN